VTNLDLALYAIVIGVVVVGVIGFIVAAIKKDK